MDVDQLLWRLLADVKQRFDLARNVPNEAERLSWELPRFLDLAARKGRVIIVIDGLHRLQDKSGKQPRSSIVPGAEEDTYRDLQLARSPLACPRRDVQRQRESSNISDPLPPHLPT